jgi:hypothetical protein
MLIFFSLTHSGACANRLIIKKAKWHRVFTVTLDTNYCGLQQ